MRKCLLPILLMAAGAAGAAIAGKEQNKTIKNKQQLADKHLTIMKVYDEWLRIRQDGRSLVQYFEKKGYKDIAIYGMGYLGESLVRELKNSDIKVQYGIDKNAENIYSSVNVVNLSVDLPRVDVIVVTTVFFFGEIYEELVNIMDCPIVSLEDAVYEMQE